MEEAEDDERHSRWEQTSSNQASSVGASAGFSGDAAAMERRASLRKRRPPLPMESVSDLGSDSDSEWTSLLAHVGSVELQIEGSAAVRLPKLKKLSWDSCLCCIAGKASSSSNAGPVKELKEKSWRTLHEAAAVRRDATYSFFARPSHIRRRRAMCSSWCVSQSLLYTTYTGKANLKCVQKSTGLWCFLT